MKKDLCNACTKAIIIDPKPLPIIHGASNSQSLNVKALPLDYWDRYTAAGKYYTYWRSTDETSEQKEKQRHVLETGDIRLVSPPELPELAIVASCYFCQKLKKLLDERYGHLKEWKRPGSLVGLQARYEWEFEYQSLKLPSELRTMVFVVLMRYPWAVAMPRFVKINRCV